MDEILAQNRVQRTLQTEQIARENETATNQLAHEKATATNQIARERATAKKWHSSAAAIALKLQKVSFWLLGSLKW